MLASITIETQPSDNSTATWYTLAQWVGGSIMVILVIFLAVGVIQFVRGKANANAESSSKGLLTAVLSLAGAVVLGTAAGAIAWSADDSNYGGGGLAGLMPAGARPAEVEVSRAGPLVSCEDTASIEAERHGNTWSSMHPTLSEHETMETMLEDNGVLDQLKDQIIEDVSLDPGGGGMAWESEQEFEQSWGEEDWGARLSRVEWIPADSGDGCGSSNRTAAADTEMVVEVWGGEGTSWHSQQQVSERTVTVPQPPAT